MKVRASKKTWLDKAALLLAVAKVASNPVLLAYLTGNPYEILKEYRLLTTQEEPSLANSYISVF